MNVTKPAAQANTRAGFLLQTIRFPNHHHSTQILTVPVEADSKQIIAELNLVPPRALIVLAGDSAQFDQVDPAIKPRLLQLITRGVARAAASSKADVMDGGHNCEIISMIGQGVEERGRKSRLIGVASARQASYPGREPLPDNAPNLPLEPHHSHFVLVEGEGEENKIMLELADTWASEHKLPVLTLLINGNFSAQREVLGAVRRRWPVIVVTGSGGLADEISELAANPPDFVADPILAEILAEGNIHLFPVTGTVAGLERLIQRQLRGDSMLKLAWEQFALYDANANQHQSTFRFLQIAILVLGVLATLLALLQSSAEYMVMIAKPQDNALLYEAIQKSVLPQHIVKFWYLYVVKPHLWFFEWTGNVLRYVIILIPIIATILLAAANRFNSGSKWLLLRGSAEAIKREIFRYRAGAEIYSERQTQEKTKEAKLAEKLQYLSRQLMQTEVNVSAQKPYQGKIPPPFSIAPQDDGMSHLSVEQYLYHRLEDQYNYYLKKTNQLEKKLQELQWLIYILGGVGTLLAALGLELWIALTGALVAAIATYLEYQQIENTLLKYNQAATDLGNVRNWWIALSNQDQEQQDNIDILVGHTERILQSEFSGWMQDMQDTLSMLKEHQEKTVEHAQQGQQNFLTSEVLSNRITRYTGGSAGDSLKMYQEGGKPSS